MNTLILANLFLASCMTGLIWFVQVVHYPLHGEVGNEQAVRYEQQHVTRTGWVVAPLMLAEVAVAAATVVWCISDGSYHLAALAWLSLLLLIAIWISTALLQVPCHRQLSLRFAPQVVRKLVRTNWIRTWCWTARSTMAFAMAVIALKP